ncbi:MAG: phenylacetate--CoA ligase family protein [Gammaproteobacteria bacterium]|nr:MAG: phenylacetate--CoA ligase family protein [Gammaproteobacteria bacterium]
MISLIKGSIPYCTFPRIAKGPAATSLALQYQLNHTQWWPEEKMREFQLKQFGNLLRHAIETVPFYQQKYQSLGISSIEKIDQYTFSNIPIISRKEVQEFQADIVSSAIPQDHGRVGKASTSGSTGRPVEVSTTELSTLMWKAFTLREHLWFKRDMSKKLAAIRYAPHGTAESTDRPCSKGWGMSTDAAFETGASAFLNSNVDIRAQADWLIRENPEYIMSHPSNILALGEHFLEKGLRIPNLLEFRSHGEPVTEKLRDVILSAFGVKITDIYSTVELGYLALQCPENDHYHVQSEGCILEILDDDDKPCAPGEIGRVVVTPLHNFASPLIRYELGDYAQVGEKCSCGRGLPVIKQVLGRVRNMVQLPDGGQIWPEFGFADFADITAIKQVQLIQHSFDLIEAKIAVTSSLSDEDEDRLLKLWRRNFRHNFDIEFTYVDEIPRGPRGKFEDFVCNIRRN